MLAQVNQKSWALAARQAELRGLSPEAQVRAAQQRLDDLAARAAAGLHYRLSLERQRWRGLDQALGNVSPLAVLNRGYAMVSQPDGTLVRQVAQVQPGDALRVRVSDGEFNVVSD
jgi:exodeoxyribonuclease VII large subunit